MRQFFRMGILLLFPLLAWGEPVKTNHATADLVQEFHSANSGGKHWVGLLLDLEKDWHTYWQNPGDSGLPTKVEWTLPEDWKISEPKWQVPKRILLAPLVNYGYSGETLLGFELEIPANAAPGNYTLKGNASWLICKEECIPEKADLQLVVRVSEVRPQAAGAVRIFSELKAQQPKSLPQGSLVSIHYEKNLLGIEFDNDPTWLDKKIDFFPLVNQVIAGKESPQINGDKITTLWMEKAQSFLSEARQLKGILVSGKNVYSLEAELPQNTSAAGVISEEKNISVNSATDSSAWMAILFAFLGGLLLNLMPCVFPVLGIKVMGFLHQNSGSLEKTRLHGYLYTFGVLVSFWALTSVLLLIRSAGESVGWGFQLQQPFFVLALIYVFSLLTANLAGFFEIGGRWMGLGSHLSEKEGKIGAFFTGVLAVVVATPCTAPFMGAAIGAVISESAWVIFFVFTALALGLAFPFLLLSWNPQLINALPKPGMWMLRLKEFFAFPMAVTVIWLLWVFGQQVGINGLSLAAIGILALFASMWIFHRFTSWAKYLGWLFVLAAIALGFASTKYKNSVASESGGWKKFSPALVEKEIQNGNAVFVDFTAAWCLTCQANKSLVLDTKAMQNFFAGKKVTLVLADWTNNDPEITKELEKHGRIGVPLYLAYKKGEKVPQVLPQVLTPDIVKSAF